VTSLPRSDLKTHTCYRLGIRTSIFDGDFAEVVGALIGDGCLCKFLSKSEGNVWRYVVAFTGPWNQDHEYYETRIRPIIYKNFGITGCIYHRRDNDTVGYFIQSERVVKFFHELGLPLGTKGENLGIPPQILADDKLARACIRGIFNTDGCIYRRYSKQYSNHPKHYKSYAVIQFKMKSRRLVEEIKAVLNKSGIRTTKIGEDKGCWVCRITTQEHVDSFMKLFGITHPHHVQRYMQIRENT